MRFTDQAIGAFLILSSFVIFVYYTLWVFIVVSCYEISLLVLVLCCVLFFFSTIYYPLHYLLYSVLFYLLSLMLFLFLSAICRRRFRVSHMVFTTTLRYRNSSNTTDGGHMWHFSLHNHCVCKGSCKEEGEIIIEYYYYTGIIHK